MASGTHRLSLELLSDANNCVMVGVALVGGDAAAGVGGAEGHEATPLVRTAQGLVVSDPAGGAAQDAALAVAPVTGGFFVGQRAWMMYLHNGNKVHAGSSAKMLRAYATQGDIVTIILDADRGELRFELNGEAAPGPAAFAGLPRGVYALAADMLYAGDTLRIR